MQAMWEKVQLVSDGESGDSETMERAAAGCVDWMWEIVRAEAENVVVPVMRSKPEAAPAKKKLCNCEACSATDPELAVRKQELSGTASVEEERTEHWATRREPVLVMQRNVKPAAA
jgi:hypothetical protein